MRLVASATPSTPGNLAGVFRISVIVKSTLLPHARLARVQNRGVVAVAILAFVSGSGLIVCWLWFVPPVLVSALVSGAFVAVAVGVRQEVKCDIYRPAPARRHWDVTVLAAFPAGGISLLGMYLESMPGACLPLPVPGQEGARPDICQTITHAQVLALVTWIGVMLLTVAIEIVGLILSSRSQIAAWAAVPTVVAGCAVAFDLSRTVALAVGKNSP